MVSTFFGCVIRTLERRLYMFKALELQYTKQVGKINKHFEVFDSTIFNQHIFPPNTFYKTLSL